MSMPGNALVLPAIVAVSALPILIAAVLVARGNLRLINGLEMLQNKRDSNPAKKHGNIPL